MQSDDPTLAELLSAVPARPRLLVVDDQPINIQVMHQIFGSHCQVFMATSGQQALNFCLSTPPDIVLLDVVMPGMDGFEVCQALKSHPETRDIPVIFVTAHTDAHQETRGLELGAVDFISKPVNPAVVRARVRTQLTLKSQSDLMRRLVFLDGLTGVFNRRYLDQQLPIEVARTVRNQTPLALIMLDVDFFKRFNDCYGHQCGDDCLRTVATSVRESLRRPADLVARYGGEEFVCLLPDTPFDSAMAIAAALERNVRSKHVAHVDSDFQIVTVSLGVTASCGESALSVTELLERADQQLYQAKNTGRGRVCGAVLKGQVE
jgi:diguanylate cyclase (GGDEF)-like protein